MITPWVAPPEQDRSQSQPQQQVQALLVLHIFLVAETSTSQTTRWAPSLYPVQELPFLINLQVLPSVREEVALPDTSQGTSLEVSPHPIASMPPQQAPAQLLNMFMVLQIPLVPMP